MNATLFETPRLLVRKICEKDFSSFHEMQGDAEVMRFTTGRPLTMEENRADLKKVIDHYESPDNEFWVWAVVRKEDLQFVGTCALIGSNEGENELGYRFLRRYWGQGFGAETLNGLISFAIEQYGVDRLVAYVNRENLASVRLLEQSLLTFEKEFFNKDENCYDRRYVWSRS